jgi:hypothetical protein
MKQAQLPELIGVYTGFLAPLLLPQSSVQVLLPPSLQLASPDPAPQSTSPLIFSFGRHSDVGLRVAGCVLTQSSYDEYSITIPDVQLVERPGLGPFAYTPLIYVESPLATIIGRLCGFQKEDAAIEHSGLTYDVTARSTKRRLIFAQFQFSESPPLPLPAWRPPNLRVINKLRFDLMASMLLQTSTASLTVQPASAQIEISRSFLPGLPLGDFFVPGLDKDEWGAFQITFPWTLSPAKLYLPAIGAEPAVSSRANPLSINVGSSGIRGLVGWLVRI